MCNYSEGVLALGEARGEAKGEAKGEIKGEIKGLQKAIESLIKNKGFTFDSALEALSIPESERHLYHE